MTLGKGGGVVGARTPFRSASAPTPIRSRAAMSGTPSMARRSRVTRYTRARVLPRRSMSPPADHPACFIVGMSRAGTTWLSKCLNEHPDAAVFGESGFFGRGYVEPLSDGTYDEARLQQVIAWLKRSMWIHGLVPGGPGEGGDAAGCLKNLSVERVPALVDDAFRDLPRDRRVTPGELFLRLCDAVGRAEGKSRVIEKTPHHVNWVDRILNALSGNPGNPGARFVIMLRDPYGFMLSYKHQGDRKRDDVRRRFEQRYHPAGCAIVWRGYARAWQHATRCHPDQTLTIPFEDVRREPEAVLERVQRFFELPVVRGLSERVPPDNTSFPAGKRPELRADDIHWMNRLAAREIVAFGEALRPAPREPGRVLASYARLPLWGVRNAISMRRVISGSPWAYLRRWLGPGAVSP